MHQDIDRLLSEAARTSSVNGANTTQWAVITTPDGRFTFNSEDNRLEMVHEGSTRQPVAFDDLMDQILAMHPVWIVIHGDYYEFARKGDMPKNEWETLEEGNFVKVQGSTALFAAEIQQIFVGTAN